jgi:MFS family permease
MNPLVVRSAIVASLSGLIFGFGTAVISGTTDALKEVFHLSDSGLGFTLAIAPIGTIAGALIAGKLADLFGREKMLFAMGILYVPGALGTALTSDYTIFMISRFLGGVGAASVCAHLYGRGGTTGGTGTSGRHGPVQHRAGNPAGLWIQRDHRRGRVSGRRLAMDVRASWPSRPWHSWCC